MSESEASSEILIEHEGPISWIVLNRPAQANALSGSLLESFSAALNRLKLEGGPVLGIRANGKGFCAGMTSANMAEQPLWIPPRMPSV